MVLPPALGMCAEQRKERGISKAQPPRAREHEMRGPSPVSLCGKKDRGVGGREQGLTSISDGRDSAEEILETDDTKPTGVQVPRQALHLQVPDETVTSLADNFYHTQNHRTTVPDRGATTNSSQGSQCEGPGSRECGPAPRNGVRRYKFGF